MFSALGLGHGLAQWCSQLSPQSSLSRVASPFSGYREDVKRLERQHTIRVYQRAVPDLIQYVLDIEHSALGHNDGLKGAPRSSWKSDKASSIILTTMHQK